MPEQDFKPFAASANANVITQNDYVASNWLSTGFSQGLAYSNQVNKVLRQSSIITSAVAQAISDVLGVTVIDDGTIATIEANFIAMFATLGRLYAKDTGTTNNLVITFPASQAPANLGSIVGVPVIVNIANTNTNTCTLNINGLGATTIVNPDGTTLSPGQINAAGLATFVYDGTHFELTTIVTGPLTSKVNTWTYGQTFVANTAFQASITVAGSVTGSSLVSTGGVSAAAGAVVTGYDAGGAQLRTINGNYGALVRNDGISLSLLQTASSNQYGAYNTFRPFSWNFTTGAVTIDGTGLGTALGGPLTVNGTTTINGALNASGIATAAAVVSDNFDINAGGQFRAVSGNYGVIFRNDGGSFYMLQTATGAPAGAYNNFRPFYWNLSNGAVTIDGTASGTFFGGGVNVGGAFNAGGTVSGGAGSFNGAINSNGNVTANNGRLRASYGAYQSGDPNAAVILNDFRAAYSATDIGYTIDPNGFIDQVYGVGVPIGGGLLSTVVTLPLAFPSQCLDAMICFLGNTPPSAPGSIAVSPYSNSQVLVTTNYGPSGVLGVIIRARGN